jgi:prevent-host-death family protein
MQTVGSNEAKSNFPRLLRQVELGETIVITRYGKAIARLIPAAPTAPLPEIIDVIEAMRSFQEQEGLDLGDDLSIRDLINEGRRF